jgi:hypothetical protein
MFTGKLDIAKILVLPIIIYLTQSQSVILILKFIEKGKLKKKNKVQRFILPDSLINCTRRQ